MGTYVCAFLMGTGRGLWLVAQALLLTDKILVTSRDIREDMDKQEAASERQLSTFCQTA